MNRAYGARFFGPLPRGAVVQDCVERRRRFEARQPGVTIVTPGRPGDRWRAVLPLGVLPDDGTTIGARSLCDLMDQLDQLYPVTEAQAGRSLDCRRDRALPMSELKVRADISMAAVR